MSTPDDLRELYEKRARLLDTLGPFLAAGVEDRVMDIHRRLAALDSEILAKRADIVGYQQRHRDAATPTSDPASDALADALRENAEALQAHTDALKATTDEMARQTQAAEQSRSFDVSRYLADIVSGQLGSDTWLLGPETTGKSTRMARAEIPLTRWQRLKRWIRRNTTLGAS